MIDNSFKFSKIFWLLQSNQMIERLVYSALVLQMAVYISQKDLHGGLGFEHTDKGLIFFVWALVQNLTPVFTGGLSDKYGRKKILVISILIAALGYFITGFQREFYPFLFSVIMIGFGLGLYRPAINGLIASNINNANSSIAWAINITLINFAVFFSPPLAKYLEEVSWVIFFSGLSLILLLSLIPIFIFKDESPTIENISITELFKSTLSEISDKRIWKVILPLSGFMMIYMQFYETLPNFIYDWIDTGKIAETLKLPFFMLSETPLGLAIDFKWLYNINSGFTVIGAVLISILIKKYNTMNGLLLGLIIATFGILISGLTNNSSYLIIGMMTYTLGEMITNPKFSQYMSEIAPVNKKSMFMGYINLALAIGFGMGSLIGGFLYKNYSEKSGLAIKYLHEELGINNATHKNAFSLLMEKKNIGYGDATNLLWNYYNPELIWIIFGVIGIVSFAMLLWGKRTAIK